MSNREVIKLERRIKTLIAKIENEEISQEDSKIGILFKIIKESDEAAYEKLLIRYKKTQNILSF